MAVVWCSSGALHKLRTSVFADEHCHWRQPRRGCRGHISPNILVRGDISGDIRPILLRTFGYSRPILVALRSLSLKPFSFGYKTPPIRFSPLPHPPHLVVRPPSLELASTQLNIGHNGPHELQKWNDNKDKKQASSSQPCLIATGTHVPYGIAQCYLPPGRGDTIAASDVTASSCAV